MLVTKTPLRISFFGGGTDIPEYYDEHDGVVVSTSIDTYIYLAINQCVPNHLKISYSKIEQVTNVEDLKHDIVRESLKHYDMTSHMEIASFSDITSKGTGLGSSSSFAVGLLQGLDTLQYGSDRIGKHDLAELASYIEISRCDKPIGKQDQYAAAYGGFNIIRFNKPYNEVEPIIMSKHDLFANLMLFDTGLTRETSSILGEHVEKIKSGVNIRLLDSMKDIAELAIKCLDKKKIDDFGALLDLTWETKKQLSNAVTTPFIDECYENAKKAGAIGGKILGAGGGGFLLLYVPYAKQNDVRQALPRLTEFKFRPGNEGSRVVLA